MEKTAGRILKGNEVKLEGSYRLDACSGASATSKERNSNSFPAQANIVENQPEYALIEVICGCGAKTLVKCEYTNPQSAEQG